MICRDINKLKEPFKSCIIELLADIKEQELPFEVFETVRTVARQRHLYNKKRTRTMRSRHITGNACDIVHKPNGRWSWKDISAYKRMGQFSRSVLACFQ